MTVSHGRRLALVLLASTALPGAAHAVSCTWKGQVAGWSSAADWTCGRAPATGDDVFVNAGWASIAAGQVYAPLSLTLGVKGAVTVSGRLDTDALHNDGLISITGTGGTLRRVGAVGAGPGLVDGSGVISLDSATATAFTSGTTYIGADQTVQGIGTLLGNTGFMTNYGLIQNTARGTLTIDPIDTTFGAGFLNMGLVRAIEGNILFSGGVYEIGTIGTIGTLQARDGTLTMVPGSRLLNIFSGKLIGGIYDVQGAGSAIKLFGNVGVSGLGDGGLLTTVNLHGAGTTLSVGNGGGSGYLSIDATLTRIFGAATLNLLDGRSFDRGATTFINEGTLNLDGGTFTAGKLTNSGEITARGAINAVIDNSGSLLAYGQLTVKTITGLGLLTVADQATLKLGQGTSGAGTLNLDGGSLALDTGSITVKNDYQNANFGSGNAFNPLANVTTAGGQILAEDASESVSGAGLSGSIMDLGATRLGTLASSTITVENRGLSTVLRGAVQTGNETGYTLSLRDFVLNPLRKGVDVQIGFGSVAGTISDTLNIVNNFANVSNTTLTLTGRVYTPAVAGPITPNPVSFTARTTQAGSTNVFISNIATGSLADTLIASVVGDGRVGAVTQSVAAGKSATMALTYGSSTAGLSSGTINFGFSSHNDEMADLALAGQTISYTAKVYATAAPVVDTTPIALGATRVGGGLSRSVTIGNANGGGTYADTLMMKNVTVVGGASVNSPGTIAAGGTGTLALSLRGESGLYRGFVVLGLASHNNDMADLALADKTISYTGAIYAAAVAGPIFPTPVTFTTRASQTASTNVFLSNDGRGALVDTLVASVVGDGRVGAVSQSVAAGKSATIALTYGSSTAGLSSGTINFGFASHNDEMADLALAGQTLSYTAKVYATAAPVVDTTPIALGATRVGGTLSRSLTIGNANGGGAYADTLMTTNVTAVGGASAISPGTIAAGGSGTLALSLRGDSGVYRGFVVLGLASHNAEMADLALADKVISYTGAIYTAAVAGPIFPNSVSFTTRTGQMASTNVFLSNDGRGALVDTLVATVIGDGRVGAVSQSVAAGKSATIALTYGSSTAGLSSGTIKVGFASHNDEMADLALAGQTLSYTAKVYATAAPEIDTTKATFAVRQGSGPKTTTITVANTAAGPVTDLLATSVNGVSPGFSAAGIGSLAGGQSAAVGVTLLDTSVAGIRNGTLTLGFGSYNGEMADLALAGQTIGLTGIVTQAASAKLLKVGGVGTLVGSGTLYTLDLGQFASGADGSFSLGVMNTILSSSYSERLAGSFAFSGDPGFSFSGDGFSDVAGGATDGGGRLSFATGSLSGGDYAGTLYLNLVSHYDGLTDLALDRIQVNIRATVLAAAGSVPEPSTWLQMIVGFGLAGAAIRRRAAQSVF